MPAPLITVITPFYNTADYLAECIESVLDQGYSDLDYVLLDNASTDGSGDIARRYAAQDPRIRLFHNDVLLPQVANYNRALEHLHEDAVYCKIVQADDKILPGALQAMVHVAERNPQVGVVCSYYLEGLRLRGDGLPLDCESLSGTEVCRRHFLEGTYILGSPTNQMYRAAVVRERRPFYREDRLHEDTEACYEILEEWDLGFVHQVLSFNRVDLDSITGRVTGWNPHGLDKFLIVHRFGRRYLTDHEMDRAVVRAEQRYLRFLGSAILEFRPLRFWRYHMDHVQADGLWNARMKLRILGYLGIEILDRILNLKRTAGRVVRFLLRR